MLLSVDTSTNTTGIALHDGKRVLCEIVWRNQARHTVELAPEVALMLRRNQLKAVDLTVLAVATGPGSYTGLRIGMALAKGLALAHSLPLVGIPTLDILAYAQPSLQMPMLAVIQAGRKRLAGGWYEWQRGAWRRKGSEATFTLQEMLERLEDPTYVCGELTAEQRDVLEEYKAVHLAPPALCVRRPAVLADMAWERVRSGKLKEPASVVPTYLGALSGKPV
ncbi:MAG TPA: tRNA (adenosine(37)-N6)-threonylcarbamoyltransferase complex dimerization subunit type 1 TsaB [Anaerolineae bacterium]|nr:tRNA (adenosine(37)-N6)-threonylcarbamoyltransferase complex dimerization subunit type 1 TsaB [Anaerolineae bacterium]